jgi:DNA-binding NarL/FixJ family response regulator
MRIRILLVDDHGIVRDGLQALLERDPEFCVVGTAADGRAAVSLSRTLRPSVVVMDLAMPGLNGMDATRKIKSAQPEISVLCLSMHSEERFVAAALDAGAAGYLVKDCAADELTRAIRVVAGGRIYLSPAVAGLVVNGYKAGRPQPKTSIFAVLTPREREVLQLIAEGHATKAIAERLHLSVKTIGTHREHLMCKLDTRSMAGLVKHAIQNGLVSADP